MSETWDIIKYSDHDLTLLLRGRNGHAVYAYPWTTPVQTAAALSSDGAEAINIPESRLFDELALRARFGAFLQATKLARSALNGSIPVSIDQIHHEALKFALRRYEKKMIHSEDFLGMIRSVALIDRISGCFWQRTEAFLNHEHAMKLKQSMDALAIFHPARSGDWLEQVKLYMARIRWFAHDFDSIKVVAKQLAILHPEHRDDFNQLGDHGNVRSSQSYKRLSILGLPADQPGNQKALATRKKTDGRYCAIFYFCQYY
jgi:hypothetical protein